MYVYSFAIVRYGRQQKEMPYLFSFPSSASIGKYNLSEEIFKCAKVRNSSVKFLGSIHLIPLLYSWSNKNCCVFELFQTESNIYNVGIYSTGILMEKHYGKRFSFSI